MPSSSPNHNSPNTPAPLSPQREAELSRQMTQALSKAGAFCGECGFEPGDEGCADCKRHYRWCVDELMPIVRAELNRTRAERDELKKRVTELERLTEAQQNSYVRLSQENQRLNALAVERQAELAELAGIPSALAVIAKHGDMSETVRQGIRDLLPEGGA